MAARVHIRIVKKPDAARENKGKARQQNEAPLDAPPTYEQALMIPDHNETPSAITSEACGREESDDQFLPGMFDPPRHGTLPVFTEKPELCTWSTSDENVQSESYAEPSDEYSIDDYAFEPFDDERDDCVPHDGIQDGSEERHVALDNGDNSCPSDQDLQSNERHDKEHWAEEDDGANVLSSTVVTPQVYCGNRTTRTAAPVIYDDQTYSVVSRLRAQNKQLQMRLEQQAKLVQHLQDEKKLQRDRIITLEHDLAMVKQALRAYQMRPQLPTSSCPASDDKLRIPSPRTRRSIATPPSYDDAIVLPQMLSRPLSPRELCRQQLQSSVPLSSVGPGPVNKRTIHTAPSSGRTVQELHSPSTSLEKRYAAKIEKLEQEKREQAARHAHQLANYSHELSRLERQVENANKLVQAKDYELRLQKSRHLYATHSGNNGVTSAPQVLPGSASLYADALWRELMPSTPPASNLLANPFTSHVGLAFEQLLSHQLLSFHDHMVDSTTRDWLHELRTCGFQLLQLHHAFQRMGRTFQRLTECCHIYQLASKFAEEVCALTNAEQAFLFVMDPAENEFWCRIPRASATPETSTNFNHDGNMDMITVRSRLMPIAGHGGVSAVAAEHTGTSATAAQASGIVPCGLASWVFHTKKPLLIPAGQVVRNPYFSTAPDNTDRLMAFKSASTLLLPVINGSTTLGVIQVCGKLTQIAALGVSIALEKCDAFTLEDQVLLTMLSHYMSGLLPKVAYFTEVESNKVNEETLIQLAPEIFTCLRFEELGKIVIQNAKEILDADRCSLFVADHAERMLFNWQSDISGRGGVEVFEDIKKTGMAIPFGHGIVGMVAETCEVINIPDAYEDPRFNSSWDKKTQYRTKSILTVPILTTTAKKQSVRRRRSQQDLYSGAIVVDRPVNAFKAANTTDDREDTDAQEGQKLLGVVQVINKSGGAPFRSKDEFLLQTISKLIALAIENSQLFQKNQELCVDLGKLIADADLVEAIASLGASAEDIIGVERAAIYVLEPNSTDLYTFHRKRRHKIVLKEHMYRHSLLQQAIETQELVVVNDLSSSYYSSMYNAYVDSIGGLAVRNVLFAPLVIDDPDDTTAFPGITSFAASTKSLKPTNGSGVLPGKKLIGVLHLVNTRGRKLMFERHDLFLSIVSAQTCSVIASILEKQAMLEQKEQTQHLLDTTLSFFKEMSPVGIINAVYNTCSSILNVEKAHLFLWEPDHRHMWTAKLSPNAESVSAAVHSTKSLTASSSGLGSSSNAIPSLRSQARRISVLTDQRIRVPTTEGLLEHVLSKSSLVVVKQWVDIIQEGEDNDDSELPSFELGRPVSSFQHSFEVSKYVLRACRSDYKAGFTSHSVVACPVWDIYGLEVVGVLVLLFPRGRAPRPSELSNLPILSRQISGALNVCGEMSAVTRRSRELQDMVEWSPRRSQYAMSLTLSARGHLVAFSQPINIGTSNFSAATLQQFVQTNSSARHSIESSRLPMDDAGHRWAFLLSGASVHEMSNEHYVNWLGRDVATYVSSNCTDEDQPPSSLPWFDKFRTDLQSVYVRKEIVHGVLHLVGDKEPTTVVKSSEYSLPLPVQLAIRRFLWEFTDARWKIDMKRACKVFDVVDPSHTRCVSRRHLEYALTTQGRNVSLDQMEWDLLHAQFADPDTDLINVERMFTSLMPQFQLIRHIGYELVPVLDSVTQSVISVHVLLTAQNM